MQLIWFSLPRVVFGNGTHGITDTPQDQSSLGLPAANPTAESEVEMPEMPNSSFDAGSSFPHRDFCRKTFARDYNRI